MKILVVDDESPVRESLINSLHDIGINDIKEAEDGMEAYEIIQQHKPDIIIADIRMPGMNGVELLTKVNENVGDIIFIFISGYDLFEYAQKAVSLGAFAYLLKPVKDFELKDVINKAGIRLENQKKQQEADSFVKTKMSQGLEFMESAKIIGFKEEQEMLMCFERCDKQSVMKLIGELYLPFKKSNVVDTITLKKLNFQLILLIYKILNHMGINGEEILEDEFTLYNRVNECGSIDSIIDLFEEKLQVCFHVINLMREKGNKKILEKAKEFIINNYNKDITLETVADYIHLSSTYFSKLFKQEFGENFVDYVINYKIKKARELLKEGIYKANEVSRMVGFNDVKYFYKIFKKHTGFTPSEYKDI